MTKKLKDFIGCKLINSNNYDVCLEEIKDIRIGLDRNKMIEVLHEAGFYKFIIEERIINALKAKEHEIIVREK